MDKNNMNRNNKEKGRDANPDPITKAPGAHPAGVGLGSAGGAAAGAAIGAAVAGPPGALVGGTVGAVAGGLAGKGAAEAVNPSVEDAYWRENYRTQPYTTGETYERWKPAYQHGWESYGRYSGKSFDEAEQGIQGDWDKRNKDASLTWEKARSATRDAWHRVERAIPGDADRDGR